MGIQDRDYMKRQSRNRSGDGSISGSGEDGPPPTDSKVEEFFSGFLQRHPRFFVYLGVAFAVVIIIALILAKLGI
jgi:hypothetical protein